MDENICACLSSAYVIIPYAFINLLCPKASLPKLFYYILKFKRKKIW